jgi:hypothetical protein
VVYVVFAIGETAVFLEQGQVKEGGKATLRAAPGGGKSTAEDAKVDSFL